MRIAQVAPLIESVPPKLYGGTERVVGYLVDELVRTGHDVTLFATGDSRSKADLVPVCPTGLRQARRQDPVALHVLMLEEVVKRSDEFDLIHFHIGELHFPVARRLAVPHVTTLHGRLDMPELKLLFKEFKELPMVSISDAQRAPLPEACWAGTVHHGLPPDLLELQPGPGEYLAFLGRISPEKRADRAIAIATAVGWPLRIAAKVDPADREYFEREIRPLLDNPLVEFIGEIGEPQKSEFLGRARALLFPIDWPEPFGLVMIEAMACGTPIVAFRGGSVPQIIDDGVTGYIVNGMEEAVEATRRVHLLNRCRCRATFERRFSVGRMAAEYVQIYNQLIGREAGMRVVTGAA